MLNGALSCCSRIVCQAPRLRKRTVHSSGEVRQFAAGEQSLAAWAQDIRQQSSAGGWT